MTFLNCYAIDKRLIIDNEKFNGFSLSNPIIKEAKSIFLYCYFIMNIIMLKQIIIYQFFDIFQISRVYVPIRSFYK